MAEAGSGPSVAIVGGGISGLVTAVRLSQLGINNVTVFDTGQKAVGGRCSSRDLRIKGCDHVVDHAAQYFTVSDPQFANIASFLHTRGAVRVWDARVGRVDARGVFSANPRTAQCFIGTAGIRTVPECLAAAVRVRRPVWVGNVVWHPEMKKWKVDRYGFFDYLVIAHSGKCADRLMAHAGAPHVHALLRVRFSDRLVAADCARSTLCSLWVLLVAFPRPLQVSFQGAHVDGDAALSWVANNSSKYAPTGPPGRTGPCHRTECWTVFSTREFGKAHKVPQEMVPEKKAEEVTDLLLCGLARVTKIPRKDLKPCYTRVQLWGAALPLNTLNDPARCVFDAGRQVGVCGDWLVSPCLQGAALSGLALAERIRKHASGIKYQTTKEPTKVLPILASHILLETVSGKSEPSQSSSGNFRSLLTSNEPIFLGDTNTATNLTPSFRPAGGPAIGAFPTDPKMYFRQGQQDQ